MATENEVRQYLAYWFQAGKGLVINSGQGYCRPDRVIQGDRYSLEFEQCWDQVQASDAGDCYLEGTSQTISDLLSPSWDVSPCARCGMPVPMISIGVASMQCPCNDMPTWPNQDLPQPRSPINSSDRLGKIRERLTASEPGD
ncbi:MAG: hypothetical protein VKK04_24105 [Synechococcales bacterium]|nr:hypothetical protein [Synechococcales bacterium]